MTVSLRGSQQNSRKQKTQQTQQRQRRNGIQTVAAFVIGCRSVATSTDGASGRGGVCKTYFEIIRYFLLCICFESEFLDLHRRRRQKMNTVNELKKLLNLDVEKIRANLLEASTLESLNRQSEALNQLVLSGGDTDQDDTDCEIVFEGGGGSAKEAGSSASHHHHQKQQDGLEISPGVDGTRVKTFEDLVKLKLQQGEQQQQQQQPIQQLRQRNPFKVQSAEKRPFLRRGEGLRRFSKGGGEITSPKDGKKTAASPKTAKSSLERPPQDNTTAIIIEKAPRPKTNVKPKNCEVITESLAGKAQPQLRREDVATEKVTKKRVDFARKVLPISRTLSQQQMTENGITSSSTGIFVMFVISILLPNVSTLQKLLLRVSAQWRSSGRLPTSRSACST